VHQNEQLTVRIGCGLVAVFARHGYFQERRPRRLGREPCVNRRDPVQLRNRSCRDRASPGIQEQEDDRERHEPCGEPRVSLSDPAPAVPRDHSQAERDQNGHSGWGSHAREPRKRRVEESVGERNPQEASRDVQDGSQGQDKADGGQEQHGPGIAQEVEPRT